MARKKRIFREWQHPRDDRGRFARRGGGAWAKRALASFNAALPEGGTATRAGDRPRISRAAKGAALFQAHADGGRPSAVRAPKAVKSAAPAVRNLEDFNAKGLPTPTKRTAPPVKNLAGFNAPDAPPAPKKRTPRPAPGAAALIAARAAEQAPQMPAMRAARTAPETTPVESVSGYAAMRRHTLVALARDAGINVRGKSNTELANELAAHDERVKASRAARLNPSGVGTSVDTPRDSRNDGGMTTTTNEPEPAAAPKMKRAHATALRQIDAKGDEGLSPGMLKLADIRALRDAGHIEERDINAPGRPKRLFLTEAGVAALRDDDPEAYAKREAAKAKAAEREAAKRADRQRQAAAAASRGDALEEQALKEGLDPLTARIGGIEAARKKKAQEDAAAAAAAQAAVDRGAPSYTEGYGGTFGENNRASTEAVNKMTKAMVKDGITIEEARAAATEQARAYATAMGRVDSARWDRDRADERREYFKNLRDLTGDPAYDDRVKEANADHFARDKALRDRVEEAKAARAALEEAVVGAYAARGKRKAAKTLKLPDPDSSYGKAGPSLAQRVEAAFTTDRKGPEVRAARAAALDRIRQEDHIENLKRQEARHESNASQIMRYEGGDSPYPSEHRTEARNRAAAERAAAGRVGAERRAAEDELKRLKEAERRAVASIPEKTGHEYADVVEAVRAASANGAADGIRDDPAKEKAYRDDIRRRLGLPADDGEPQMAREAIPVAPSDVRFGDYVQGGNGGLGFQVAAIEPQEDGSIRLTGVGLLGVRTRTVRPGDPDMKVWRPGVSDQNRAPLRDDEADLPIMARRMLEGFTDERARLAAANRVRASKGLPEKGMTPGRIYRGQFTREAKEQALKSLPKKRATPAAESTPAPTEREAKLAAKRAELEAARARLQAAADYQAGGSSKRKTFAVRMDAALRRGGEARRDIERLEREIAALERPEPKAAGPVNFDDIKPGGIIKRDGQYYRVVKVNAKTVKVEMPPGWDDLFKKDKKITEVHPPKAEAAQAAVPARARISPDAKRAAIATVDTPRVNRQDGGMANTGTPDAPQLGVTESSKGRTTTVTLPDGTTAQRTSKTMAYTHAVVATRDLHADAQQLRASIATRRRYLDAYRAWVDAGADRSQLVAAPSASSSYNDRQAGLVNYYHYLPGFEPRRTRTRLGNPDHEAAPGAFAVISSQRHRSGGPHTFSDYEGYEPQRQLRDEEARIARDEAQAAKLESGPQYDHYVARWSQRADTAHAAIGSPEVNAPNTRYQVVGVGGVSKPEGKPVKKVPTAAEKAAALEAKKAAEKDAAEKRKQDFFDRAVAGVTEALNASGNEGRDDPEWHLRGVTEQALVALAKHLKVKVPNREQGPYGPRQRTPEQIAAIRRSIIDAVRAQQAPKADAPAVPGTARAIPGGVEAVGPDGKTYSMKTKRDINYVVFVNYDDGKYSITLSSAADERGARAAGRSANPHARSYTPVRVERGAEGKA